MSTTVQRSIVYILSVAGKFYSHIFLALDIEQLQKNKCVKYAVDSFWYETQQQYCFNLPRK